MKDQKWENSRFTSFVRITPYYLNFLKEIKGKKSIAGVLEIILQKYESNSNRKKK